VGSLPGHFSQILGDSAEEDFYALARAIGYGIIRQRNPSPGIDFVAEFTGTTVENCILLRPPHSPNGPTAFSVKSGDATSADVRELIDYVADCQRSRDPLLRQIAGGVLVVGAMKTKDQINHLSDQGVACWDMRRLIFYSIKAKTVARLADTGRVVEHPLLNGIKGGFVQAPQSMPSNSVFAVEVHLFVDDHDLVIQADHLTNMLDQVYNDGLRPIIQATRYDIELRLSLHAMGPIQRVIVNQAYRDYSSRNRPGLILPSDPEFVMQSYATSPWASIFRV
jgi:hypothetical protein